MIVRIMGEGQLKVDDSHLALLNTLDSELLEAVQAGDEGQFATRLSALLDQVRGLGEPLADDALAPSQLILPAAGASLDEVRKLLEDDGLIPG